MIGDEPHEPYDRPPLSKQVALGWVRAEHTMLPCRAIDVEWRLGVAATGLDLAKKTLQLADGQTVEFDRLLIATGTRARPWFNQEEAALKASSFCVLRRMRGNCKNDLPRSQSVFLSREQALQVRNWLQSAAN